MKSSHRFFYVSSLLLTTLIFLGTINRASAGQQKFTSSDEAITALKSAAQAQDPAAFKKLFGPDFKKLMTGDKIQDADHARHFASAVAEGCSPVSEGDDKITLEIGTNNWPFPIPLVRTNGDWLFDTAAGQEEIMDRHIGKNELHAIGVCRAYVDAQKKYASVTKDATGSPAFAQKFLSSPGKKDGLYWVTTNNEPASPFGPLVAKAQAEGYERAQGNHAQPFHGYYFKILTRQGEAAMGSTMDYMANGRLSNGYALVAYPEHWDRSGIMTFIVNQDGKVFQRNFGPRTGSLARALKEYNPDKEWMLVDDSGVTEAVMEK